MAGKWQAIHPFRLAAVLLLAGTLAYGTYHLMKPEMFSYIKVREGVVAEGGTPLKAEQIEKAVLPVNRFFSADRSPVPGLLPWADAEYYLGTPLAHRVTGGEPLMLGDLDRQGEGGSSGSLQAGMTGMSIPVDNIVGITPHLPVGSKVHIYASFEDQDGAHSGLLLREMPILSIQREMDGEIPRLAAVTIGLTLDQAVLLTHALHYGKIHLAEASRLEAKGPGIGDHAFASALLKTKKRWSDSGEER
ncbi:hypothetical protein [Brevibacillus massiliensis]|jgi:pilus assembly protein CpaB|uniref:hypothetical protein n=1 Tax=Brevibacillus massiliensis TaxID=1118054 RepID=UPI0002D6A9E6|nr:hypothetical protein [Brevibacillus massiliensis]